MINKKTGIVQQQSLRWAAEMRLVTPGGRTYRRFGRAKIAWLAGLTQPAAGLEDLQLSADWHSWLFFHDDLCDASAIGHHPDRQEALDRELVEVLRGTAWEGRRHPLAPALEDVVRRLGRRAGWRWLRRFARDVEAYLASNRWEAANRMRRRTPELANYVEMRQLTGAVDSCFDLVAIASGLAADSRFLSSFAGRRLAALANRNICWTNDVLGLTKEIGEGNINNLVWVLRQELRVSLEDATLRAKRMCESEKRRFLDLEKRLRQRGNLGAAPRRYVRGLRTWMDGHVEWYGVTRRYSSADGTGLASARLAAGAPAAAVRRRGSADVA